MKNRYEAHPHGMRIVVATIFFSAIAIAVACITAPSPAAAQSRERSVQGRVVSSDEAPVANAIVYLNDTRTNAVTSYITQQDGAYSFEQISSTDDYHLWAQINGEKSKVKTISSFDERGVFHVILKIETRK